MIRRVSGRPIDLGCASCTALRGPSALSLLRHAAASSATALPCLLSVLFSIRVPPLRSSFFLVSPPPVSSLNVVAQVGPRLRARSPRAASHPSRVPARLPLGTPRLPHARPSRDGPGRGAVRGPFGLILHARSACEPRAGGPGPDPRDRRAHGRARDRRDRVRRREHDGQDRGGQTRGRTAASPRAVRTAPAREAQLTLGGFSDETR